MRTLKPGTVVEFMVEAAIEAALQVRDPAGWIFNRQGIALARPFRVDLSTGESTGGSYFDEDTEGWDRPAE